MDEFYDSDIDIAAQQADLGRFEYIIVGSGMGGGILAEELAKRKKSVLLIEKGYPTFSTHVVNTARPDFARGKDDSPEGNETIYNKMRAWVQVADGSEYYSGGPLYCLGGRSLVWGLWIPRTSKETLEAYFPPAVASDLLQTYFDKAFNLLTNNSQTDAVYPEGHINAEELDATITEVTAAIQGYIYPGYSLHLGPIATELISSAPYRFPQGAYSTVGPLLNRIYSRDPYLTVLMGAEVLNLELSKPSDPEPKLANSLTLREVGSKEIHKIPTAGAKVILSAGTICTAQIALNSGLKMHNPLVGSGLIDHAIYAVRFARRAAHKSRDPMCLQTYIKIFDTIALLTVTVNNNFFLAGKTTLPISQYITRSGDILRPTDGQTDIQENVYDTIAVLIEFSADLVDQNEVLPIAAPHPVIRMNRMQLYTSEAQQVEMQNLATRIRNGVITRVLDGAPAGLPYDPQFPSPQLPGDDDPSPRLTLLPAGIFAHEVGTMRMSSSGKPGVVDENLLVKGFSNLYACDLSVMPHSPEANPSITLAGITLRLVDHLTSSQ